MTKFGKEYRHLPTPLWVNIIKEVIDWGFGTIAAGTIIVPDEWTSWKYVVAFAGALAMLWGRLKPYFGIVEDRT